MISAEKTAQSDKAMARKVVKEMARIMSEDRDLGRISSRMSVTEHTLKDKVAHGRFSAEELLRFARYCGYSVKVSATEGARVIGGYPVGAGDHAVAAMKEHGNMCLTCTDGRWKLGSWSESGTVYMEEELGPKGLAAFDGAAERLSKALKGL